jgi:hypothetical protein
VALTVFSDRADSVFGDASRDKNGGHLNGDSSFETIDGDSVESSEYSLNQTAGSPAERRRGINLRGAPTGPRRGKKKAKAAPSGLFPVLRGAAAALATDGVHPFKANFKQWARRESSDPGVLARVKELALYRPVFKWAPAQQSSPKLPRVYVWMPHKFS